MADKKHERLTRRHFLSRMAAVGAVTMGAGYLIGCKPQKEGGGGDKGASAGGEKDVCSDLSGLSETEMKTRNSLNYVDESPKPEKNCANCSLYQPEKFAESCGGCQVLKGPVEPEGYCTAWAAKS